MREAAFTILIFLLAVAASPRALASATKRTTHKPVAVAHASRGHGTVARRVAHAERTRPRPARREPAREPREPAADPIEVRHDRKLHFTAAPRATPSRWSSRRPAKVSPALTTAAISPAASVAESSDAVPVLYNKQGRLIVPAALKGSHEILVHQNEMADSEGLDRVQNDADLDRLRESRLLVPIPAVTGLASDERLPSNRRYCRPWTAQFLAVLARTHYARFHAALQVNSAVRTVEVQERLLRTNGNAAPAEGATASPHLTGQAIDIGKHGLSLTEIAWLRGYLLPLVQAGKVDVEEEFQQACFHISVYRSYVPEPAPRREIAEKRHPEGAALATAIR
jgi:hypothetical protein